MQMPRWVWILVALGAHTGWGIYPVLARYLQTISGLPTMSLLVFGNTLALLVLIGSFWKHLDARFFGLLILWLLGIVVVGRSTTNLIASQYTLAIYVQLVTLLTPFQVALLATLIFHEQIPRFTFSAVVVSFVGSLMIISSPGQANGFQFVLTPSDWFGILIALISSFCLATYMVLVRRTVSHNVSGESVLLVQLCVIIPASLLISFLIGEDWAQWGAIGLVDWCVFALFAFGVLLGSNIGQIIAIRHFGAPFFSSMLAWRLVSALFASAVLLQEYLTSVWQLFGVLLVLLTITWYIWQQPQSGAIASRHS